VFHNILVINSRLVANILPLGRGRFPECLSVKGLLRELIPNDIRNIATKTIPSSSCTHIMGFGKDDSSSRQESERPLAHVEVVKVRLR
jgi:hypothetical protein